jgi:hypothetical protein
MDEYYYLYAPCDMRVSVQTVVDVDIEQMMTYNQNFLVFIECLSICTAGCHIRVKNLPS